MGWRERQEQFRRFAAWEDEQRRSASPDPRATLQWMDAAWQLARRADPSWDSWARIDQHCRELARARAGLFHVRPRP
jgi:hypothetical protein